MEGPSVRNSSSNYTIVLEKDLMGEKPVDPRVSIRTDPATGNLIISIQTSAGQHTVDSRATSGGTPEMPQETTLTISLKYNK